MKIRKKPHTPDRSVIRKTDVSGENISFSFKFFDHTDDELCPATFEPEYTQKLMRRLRALSSWTVEKFQKSTDSTIRNHHHGDWQKTSRPGGFGKLKRNFSSQLKAYPVNSGLSICSIQACKREWVRAFGDPCEDCPA